MSHFYPVIHPTAIIHPKAKLDSTVRVGPYAVIDEGVELGAHCVVGPHVYLTGLTTIGAHNRFHAGCVIGDAPQDLKYKGEPTRLRIGDHNVLPRTCHGASLEQAGRGNGHRLAQFSHGQLSRRAQLRGGRPRDHWPTARCWRGTRWCRTARSFPATAWCISSAASARWR